MNRRLAIQRIIIVSAGAAVLPSCMHSDSRPTISLKKLQISGSQQGRLAILTQAIIPTTDTPGAKEMKSDEFILKMIDDCASPEDQQKFVSGMKQFEEFTRKKYGDSFSALDKAKQKEVLAYLDDKKNAAEEAAVFYKNVKGLTLQSYTGSEYFMTNVMKYNMIPKKYKGCVPVV